MRRLVEAMHSTQAPGSSRSFTNLSETHASSGTFVEHMQGSPFAWASIAATPRPSKIDGNAKTSEAESTPFMSRRSPANTTRSPKPRERESSSSLPRKTPSPTSRSLAVGTAFLRSGRSLMRNSWFFWSVSLPTEQTTTSSSAKENSRLTRSRSPWLKASVEKSMAFGRTVNESPQKKFPASPEHARRAVASLFARPRSMALSARTGAEPRNLELWAWATRTGTPERRASRSTSEYSRWLKLHHTAW